MSDQLPSLEDLNTIDESTSRRLFAEAIEEVITLNTMSDDEADTLRICAWAAYARLDLKALGHGLQTGEITMAEAMTQCLPTVAQILAAGMQTSKTLH
jgi:hypothetical protein